MNDTSNTCPTKVVSCFWAILQKTCFFFYAIQVNDINSLKHAKAIITMFINFYMFFLYLYIYMHAGMYLML